MNNYEYIKSCSLEDLAHFFCKKMEEVNNDFSCTNCPVKNKCFPDDYESHNGFRNWLEEDYEKEKQT